MKAAHMLPRCREGVDSGEENRRLHVHVDPQGQLPVVALHSACSPRVLEVQNRFQSLQKERFVNLDTAGLTVFCDEGLIQREK